MASLINKVLQEFEKNYAELAQPLVEALKSFTSNAKAPSTHDVKRMANDTGFDDGIAQATDKAILKASRVGARGVFNYVPRAERPWDEGGLTLSQKIHGAEKRRHAMIANIVGVEVRKGARAEKIAQELYDGYGAADVMKTQDLPKYLADVLRLSRSSNMPADDGKEIRKAIRNAQRQIDRLSQGGAPTKALKASYQQLLNAVKKGREKAVDNAINVAINEKSRYVAMRIARTESARAWYNGFLERYANDRDVVAFKYSLASRHPAEDECDTFAAANMYGIGKGLYPKGEQPELPVHPHCLCYLAPAYPGDIDYTHAGKSDTGKWLDSLSAWQKVLTFGEEGAKLLAKGKTKEAFAKMSLWHAGKHAATVAEMAATASEIVRQPKTIDEPFEPATTIEEATAYAHDTLGIKTVYYDGIDIQAANIMNESLRWHFENFPELKKSVRCVGSFQKRLDETAEVYRADIKPKLLDSLKQKWGGQYSDEDLEKVAEKWADDLVKQYRKGQSRETKNMLVCSYSGSSGIWAPYDGIFWNKFKTKDMAALMEGAVRDGKNGWHPTSSVRSYIDHELGHQMDALTGISSHLEKYGLAMPKDWIAENVGRYAATKNAEYVAECWADFLQKSPKAEISADIGKRIMELYNEKFGAKNGA